MDQGYSFRILKNKNSEFKQLILPILSKKILVSKHSLNAKISVEEEEDKRFEDHNVQSFDR